MMQVFELVPGTGDEDDGLSAVAVFASLDAANDALRGQRGMLVRVRQVYASAGEWHHAVRRVRAERRRERDKTARLAAAARRKLSPAEYAALMEHGDSDTSS
jgi:hypothetical protein